MITLQTFRKLFFLKKHRKIGLIPMDKRNWRLIGSRKALTQMQAVAIVVIIVVVAIIGGAAYYYATLPAPTPTPTPTATPTPTLTPTPTTPTPAPTPTPTPSPEARGWMLEGHFVSFTSICDLKPEPLGPKRVTIGKGSKFTTTGCTSLDEELKEQQPLAIIIKIRNSASISRTLTVPLLSDVIVHTEADSKPALAFCLPASWVGGAKGACAWVTKVEDAKLEVEMEPEAAVELLYLIPRFSGEATIELVNIGSFKIKAG